VPANRITKQASAGIFALHTGDLTEAPLLAICIAYPVSALILITAGRFPDFGAMFPHWLYSAFNAEKRRRPRPRPASQDWLNFKRYVRGLVTRNLPRDENSPHSADQRTSETEARRIASSLRFPCSAKPAP
jgi:hypothetical protein